MSEPQKSPHSMGTNSATSGELLPQLSSHEMLNFLTTYVAAIAENQIFSAVQRFNGICCDKNLNNISSSFSITNADGIKIETSLSMSLGAHQN